jgi:hypothetical protein
MGIQSVRSRNILYAPSWNGGKRCLFLTGGYYEWQPVEDPRQSSGISSGRRMADGCGLPGSGRIGSMTTSQRWIAQQ